MYTIVTDADNQSMRCRAMFLLLTLFCANVLVAQEARAVTTLQRGFSSVSLGMSLEATKSMLEGDVFFRYRGDPDVSLVPSSQAPLIDAEGRSFIERGLFQFRDDALYLISLVLDRERIDYFSVFESLVAQYGDPSSLSPQNVHWDDDQTRITLERPLTVKYTDRQTFEAIVEEGQMLESLEDVSRDLFLQEL